MTMVKKTVREVPAGEFKAKCLALLDEVAASGRDLVVTKRGRPVAKVVPIREERRRSLRGSIVFESDIVSPIGETWDAENRIIVATALDRAATLVTRDRPIRLWKGVATIW